MITIVNLKKIKPEIKILIRCAKEIWLVSKTGPSEGLVGLYFLSLCHEFGKPKFIQQK
jgi:hypothetical protein